MVKTIKLMIGTNVATGKDILKRDFRDLSWWSDNLETVAHYYEGCAIEITVKLDSEKKMEYVRDYQELDELKVKIEDYTYGYIDVICPKDATWYSFSKEYLEKNIVKIEEIFPDLRAFNEEE